MGLQLFVVLGIFWLVFQKHNLDISLNSNNVHYKQLFVFRNSFSNSWQLCNRFIGRNAVQRFYDRALGAGLKRYAKKYSLYNNMVKYLKLQLTKLAISSFVKLLIFDENLAHFAGTKSSLLVLRIGMALKR